jgi:hypothetical protein
VPKICENLFMSCSVDCELLACEDIINPLYSYITTRCSILCTLYNVHCTLSRQSNILFNIPNNITYKLSEVRRGEEMGQQGKRGGEKAGKYQGKDKRRKNITIMYKICRKKGGLDQRGRGRK